MSLPAPSLPALLNFDGQLTYAARQILNAGGFPDTWQRGQSDVRPDAATAVAIDIGEASGRLGLRPERTTEHAQYTARLSVMVAIERAANEPVAGGVEGTSLDRVCARLRALFLNHPNPFAAYQDDVGVYLQVHAIRPLAPEYLVSEDTAVDSRVLNFELMFVIPDSAWPAVNS